MKLQTASGLVALVAAAGCSGGGNGQPAAPIPSASSQPAAAQSATITFAFAVAPKPGAALQPKFVSPNAAFFVSTITSYNGLTTFPSWLKPTTTVALSTAAGGNCVVSGSTETCTVTVPTYPGTVGYTFSLEDAARALLGQYSADWKVKQGANTVISFTFHGVPVTVTVTLPVPLFSHRAFSEHILVVASDASGAPITSGPYLTPITLTDNDPSGATALTVNHGPPSASVVLTEQGSYVRLNYSGLAIAPFHLTATGGAISSGTTTVTPHLDPILVSGTTVDRLNPRDPDYGQQTLYIDKIPPATPPTFGVSELGWSNAPYSKGFIATPGPAGCSSSVATVSTTNGLTFLVDPVAAGYCELSIAGGGGLVKTVWVSVTTTSIGINVKQR